MVESDNCDRRENRNLSITPSSECKSPAQNAANTGNNPLLILLQWASAQPVTFHLTLELGQECMLF